METTVTTKTVGEMVAQDYRNASVFQRYGIDFCCKGNKSIDQVCEERSIPKEGLLRELEQIAQNTSEKASDYNSWPIDLLADYIEKKHHRYIEETTAQLKTYLEKICTVHGKQHPELFTVKELFFESAADLAVHMKKEELILFPYIRKMMLARKEKQDLPKPPFGTIQNPIEMMKHEHDDEGDRFRKIAELTNNYTTPSDACNTYKVTFSLLKEFETDLHLHIHLENNILFPKAEQLENADGRA